MKYQILWDYGGEGLKLDYEDFETIDEAIRHAVASNNCLPFYIIIVYWQPKLKTA